MRALVSMQGLVLLLQIITCGFSLSFIFSLISKVVFSLKMLGMRIKLGVIITLESIGAATWLLLPVIFHTHFSILKFVLTLIFGFISISIAWYDETFFVYTESEISEANKD